MKIQNLSAKAVRSTGRVRNVTQLTAEELKDVVGGREVGTVDPETCAIHFYYPADALA